eukprot:c1582_g1_i2.p1 GENE.c1582_g1_i2~~c1582_g1_i2.p1  ORF type:complete len:285 (+),score=36.79 c1582_g1_i2:126-980(+)
MGSLMESPEAVVVYRQQLPKLAERYGLFSIHFQLLSNADFLEIVEEVARACRIGVGPFHGPAAKAIYLEMINAVKDVGEPSDESATLISMFCFKWQAAGVPYASRFDAIGLSVFLLEVLNAVGRTDSDAIRAAKLKAGQDELRLVLESRLPTWVATQLEFSQSAIRSYLESKKRKEELTLDIAVNLHFARAMLASPIALYITADTPTDTERRGLGIALDVQIGDNFVTIAGSISRPRLVGGDYGMPTFSRTNITTVIRTKLQKTMALLQSKAFVDWLGSIRVGG